MFFKTSKVILDSCFVLLPVFTKFNYKIRSVRPKYFRTKTPDGDWGWIIDITGVLGCFFAIVINRSLSVLYELY